MKTTKNDSTSQNTKSEEGCGRHFLQDHCDCGEPMTTHPTPTAEILKEMNVAWVKTFANKVVIEPWIGGEQKVYAITEDQINHLVAQALQRQREEIVKSLRMEKKGYPPQLNKRYGGANRVYHQ